MLQLPHLPKNTRDRRATRDKRIKSLWDEYVARRTVTGHAWFDPGHPGTIYGSAFIMGKFPQIIQSKGVEIFVKHSPRDVFAPIVQRSGGEKNILPSISARPPALALIAA